MQSDVFLKTYRLYAKQCVFSTSIVISCTASERTVAYQGCFSDESSDRDLDRDVTDDVIGDISPITCAAACKERSSRYKYAGVQNDREVSTHFVSVVQTFIVVWRQHHIGVSTMFPRRWRNVVLCMRQQDKFTQTHLTQGYIWQPVTIQLSFISRGFETFLNGSGKGKSPERQLVVTQNTALLFVSSQSGFRCYCDDSFGKHGRTKGCNDQCPGDNPDRLRCGSRNKNAIYRIDGKLLRWSMYLKCYVPSDVIIWWVVKTDIAGMHDVILQEWIQCHRLYLQART